MDWWNLSLILVLVPQTTVSLYLCQSSTGTGTRVRIEAVINSGEDDKLNCMCIVTLLSQQSTGYVHVRSITNPTGNEFKLKYSVEGYPPTYYSSSNYNNSGIHLPSSKHTLYINVVKGTTNYGGFSFDLQVYSSQGYISVTCMRNQQATVTTTTTTTTLPKTTTTATSQPTTTIITTTTTTPQPISKTEITTPVNTETTILNAIIPGIPTTYPIDSTTTNTKGDNSSSIIIGSLVGVVVIMAGIIIFLLCSRRLKSANLKQREENRTAITSHDNNMNSERAQTDGNTYDTLYDNNEYEAPIYSQLGPQYDLEGLKANSTPMSPSILTQESMDTVCDEVAELTAMNNLRPNYVNLCDNVK